MPQTVDPKSGELVVSETRSAVWSYHLRLIGPEGFKPSGLLSEYRALCGRGLGWDTRIPLGTYGSSNNTMDRWCSECLRIAKENPNVGEAQRSVLSRIHTTVQPDPTKALGRTVFRRP